MDAVEGTQPNAGQSLPCVYTTGCANYGTYLKNTAPPAPPRALLLSMAQLCTVT